MINQDKVKYKDVLAFCSRDQKWLMTKEEIATHIRDCVRQGNFVIGKDEENLTWQRIIKEKENDLDFT